MSSTKKGFDVNSVSRNTWIAGAGALVLLIGPFFSWFSASVAGFSISQSGWDSGILGKLCVLVGLAAVALIVAEAMGNPLTQLPIPKKDALLYLGAAGVGLVLLKILDYLISDSGPVDLAFGIFLTLIGAAALAYISYTERTA